MARTFQPSPWSITGGPLSQAGSAITGNNLTRAMGALRSKNSGYDSIYSDQIGNEASLYRAESAGNVAVNQAEWNAWANDRISRRQSNSINKEANKNKIGGALKLGTSLAIGAISLFSDVKTKNTIEDLNNATELLRELRPVSFYYNEEYSAYDNRLNYGFIAQEYVKVMPDATYVDGDTGLLTIDTMQLIALLVKSNQELAKRIDLLEASSK
jgi:hypothetical protein